jgi:hypothetical protein
MNIAALWAQQPGEFFCASTKSQSGKWTDTFFARRELSTFREFLRNHSDKDLYFCPHGFTKNARRKEFSVPPYMLYADLDEVDPRTINWKPTIALESSPGRYVGFWLTDEAMSEDLNRRMTYAVGADHGGWDLTQVLRVPLTTNFKYQSLPKVRLLWDDGPVYSITQLERDLPEAPRPTFMATDIQWNDLLIPEAVWRNYQNVPIHIRKNIEHGKPGNLDDRSVKLWTIYPELFKRGMSPAEVCAVMKPSRWNKFVGRTEQLKSEIAKAYVEYRNTTVAPSNGSGLQVIWADQAGEPETQKFLWYPYISQGDISVLAAYGGVGKGLVGMDIAARVTRGNPWPCSTERAPQGTVLWGEAEDKLKTVMLPRLVGAGADRSKVAVVSARDFTDKKNIRDFIYAHNVKLIVLSPFISFLESLEDMNSALNVRDALAYINDLIDGTECSVLGLMHLNKKEGDSAVLRILGSVDFANFCRSAITLRKENDEQGRMAHIKHNLSGRGDDLLFEIHNTDGNTRGQFLRLEWEAADDNVDVSGIFDRQEAKSNGPRCIDWLKEFLVDGHWWERDAIMRAGEAHSHSEKSIMKARQREPKIEVRVKGFGKDKVSEWRLT